MMMQENIPVDVIQVRGLGFPRDQSAQSNHVRMAVRDGMRTETLANTAVGVARTSDRILVLGSGAAIVPVLLAGNLGVPRVHVVEPDPGRRAYLEQTASVNGLFRIGISVTVPLESDPTLLVADLSEEETLLPEALPSGSLRGAVLRIPDDTSLISETFARMADAGLTYFPRQSSGNVVTFLAKWSV